MEPEDFVRKQEARWSKISADLSANSRFLAGMDILIWTLYALIFLTPILSISVYLLQILNEK